MNPAALATALLLSVAAFAVSFAVCAVVVFRLAAREPAPQPSIPQHLKPARRHHAEPSREWFKWAVSLLVRIYRYEDGAPKTAVVFASLLVGFSLLIGAGQ